MFLILTILSFSADGWNYWMGDPTIVETCTVQTPVATVPRQVVQINRHAFFGCASSELVFEQGSNIKILAAACFSNSKFVRIIVPDSVTEIGEGSFGGIVTLEYVELGSSFNHLPTGLFEHDEKLRTVIFESKFLLRDGTLDFTGHAAQSIGKYVFDGCNIVKVIIPSVWSDFEDGAFTHYGNIQQVEINKRVSIVVRRMFAGNYLMKVLSISGRTVLENGKLDLSNSDIVTIEDLGFAQVPITNLVIPSRVEYHRDAFRDNFAATYIEVQKPLADNFQFIVRGDVDIVSFKVDRYEIIRDSVLDLTGIPVVSIDGRQFSETGIVSAIIPSTVTNVGLGAFYKCQKLRRIVIDTNVVPDTIGIQFFCRNT